MSRNEMPNHRDENPLFEFIHIGLHKTGSKYLQTTLFVKHPELRVVGHPIIKGYEVFWKLLSPLKWSENKYDSSVSAEQFKALIHKHLESDRIRGISDESLCGGHHSVWNREYVAHRLRDTFGPAKIIIVLRHPLTYMASVYSQYIRQGGVLSYREYFSQHDILLDFSQFLNYKALIHLYADCFGKKQLLILPYEFLKDDKQAFVDRICCFLEISPVDINEIESKQFYNRSLLIHAQQILRHMNRVFSSSEKFRNSVYRVISYLDKHTSFPTRKTVSLGDIGASEPLSNLLRNENYVIWHNDLSTYNYTFSTVR